MKRSSNEFFIEDCSVFFWIFQLERTEAINHLYYQIHNRVNIDLEANYNRKKKTGDEFSFPSIQPTKLNMIKLEIHFIGAGKVPVSM